MPRSAGATTRSPRSSSATWSELSRRAAAATGGIHRDLVLRLDAAARFPGPGGEPFGAAFERSFGEGYAAGQAGG